MSGTGPFVVGVVEVQVVVVGSPQPEPTPSVTRPPDSWSRVATRSALRVVDGEQEDVRADADALGAGGDRTEEQQRVARPAGHEVVVAQGQRVEATALGQAREGEHGGVWISAAGSWKTGRLREKFIGLLVGPSRRGARSTGEVTRSACE
jgi:hypothetical protein